MGQAPSVIREAIKQRSPRVIVKLVRASRQCHLAAELGSVDLLMVLVRTYSAAAHLHRGVDERVFELERYESVAVQTKSTDDVRVSYSETYRV